jgi:hypothetical protein
MLIPAPLSRTRAMMRRQAARKRGICPVIPYRSNTIDKPKFSAKVLYKARARIEQMMALQSAALREDGNKLCLIPRTRLRLHLDQIRPHGLVHVVVMMVVMVVTIIPAMVMVVMIPAMVMVVVVMVLVMVLVPIVILREFHVGILLGLPLGARYVHCIGGRQQSDRIRDWLEQLRIRPGVQDFSCFPRPRRFHRGHRCKGGDCARNACDLLVHVALPRKIHASGPIQSD